MMGQEGESLTLVGAVVRSLDSARRGPEGVTLPVAIQWTDANGQWRALLPALQKASAQLYVRGEHAPARRTAPAIALRCTVDCDLPNVSPQPGAAPILGMIARPLTACDRRKGR